MAFAALMGQDGDGLVFPVSNEGPSNAGPAVDGPSPHAGTNDQPGPCQPGEVHGGRRDAEADHLGNFGHRAAVGTDGP